MATQRFDIEANIPPGTTSEQFNLMLATLLRERFHLLFHIETRDRSVYALRVADADEAGRPVVDETGLTRLYDFKIHFEQVHRAENPDVASDPAPTVFDAVERQLGLKLEGRNGASEFPIIDSIDREPTPN